MGIDYDVDELSPKTVKTELGNGVVRTVTSYHVLDLASSKERLEKYREQIKKFESDVNALVVNDEATRVKAVEYGTMASGLIKKIKETTTAIIKEPNEFVKAVKNLAKPFEADLDKVVDDCKSKISAYTAIEEQKRREREAAMRAEAAKLQAKMDEDAKLKGIEAVKVPVPAVSREPETVRTETGSQYSREKWVFEIEDITKVPYEYLQVNESLVNNAINKQGKRKISGLNIKRADTIVFRT